MRLAYPRWKRLGSRTELYYVREHSWLYEVRRCGRGAKSVFIVGGPPPDNRLDDCRTLQEAKKICEDHFEAHRNQRAEEWGIQPTQEIDSGFSVEEWKSRVLDLCQKGHVSMVEIARLPGAKGIHEFGSGSVGNVIFWHSLQEALVRGLVELIEEGRVVAKPSSQLVYFVDGLSLRLPIARPGRRSYRSLHWLPIVLNLSGDGKKDDAAVPGDAAARNWGKKSRAKEPALTDEVLVSLTDEQLHLRADRLLSELHNRPMAPRNKALKRVREVIAEKLAAAGIDLDRQGCCRFVDGVVLTVDTREYEPDIYRLHLYLSPGGGFPLSELSFIEADLPHLRGEDLAAFLEKIHFGHPGWEDVRQLKWELFSHAQGYPSYAWTEAANAFYYRRHAERLRYVNERLRRQKQSLICEDCLE